MSPDTPWILACTVWLAFSLSGLVAEWRDNSPARDPLMRGLLAGFWLAMVLSALTFLLCNWSWN